MAVVVRVRPSVAVFGKYRDQVALDGVLDSSNRDFMIPGGEKAVHNPSGGLKVKAYHNTRRLQETEFTVLESGGAGTGFDIVRLTAFAPPSTSRVFADFVAA
jgi:hypothetical protein